MTAIQMKLTGLLKADPNNPRKAADDKDVDQLGDDMLARGVLVPLLVKPDMTIIDGWRRWLAAQRKGIKELPVIVTDRPEDEIPAIQMSTVFHKVDLIAYDKAMACIRILELHPGWQMKDLAEYLHIDPSSVTRWCSLSRVIQAWRDALKDGKVGISDVYAASKLPEKDQAGLLSLKLSGASRDTIEQAGRKKRSGDKPAVKVSRLKIPLPGGMVVQISGKDLDLDGGIESTKEALKALDKARKEGLDSKTAQAVWRDKARG